jgi:hypothetical protein
VGGKLSNDSFLEFKEATMKLERLYKFLTLSLTFSVAFASFGQDSLPNNAKVLFELKDLRQIDSSEICSIAGIFSTGGTFVGYSYFIDSNGLFRKADYSCLDYDVSDSGVYKMVRKGQLELISKKGKTRFIVFRFDKFLFMVPTAKANAFRKEYLSQAKISYELKPVKFNGERYTDQFSIAFRLMKNYLVKLK